MVIETLLFIASVVVVGAALVKAYEWYHDVLYGPYMQSGSIEGVANNRPARAKAKDHTLYASHTVWNNRATFEAWTKGRRQDDDGG